MLVSQPFETLASQLAKPGLQLIVHVPAEQPAMPFSELQAFVHEPQWFGSLPRSVSQPFAKLPSQLARLEAHAIVQVPAEQRAVPFVELHTFVHEPQ